MDIAALSPQRVNRLVFTVGRWLPVHLRERTSSGSFGRSEKCQQRKFCLMPSRQAIVQSGSPATVQSLKLRRSSGLRSEKYSPLLLHPSVQSPHSSRLATRGREQLGEMLRYSSPTQGRHRDYLEANNRSDEGPFSTPPGSIPNPFNDAVDRQTARLVRRM